MKFKKKPIVIEAEQFFPDKEPWPGGVYRIGGNLKSDEGKDTFVRLKTLEGEFKVKTGDWIVTGIKGERYPVKPDIFEMTYEPVTPPVTHMHPEEIEFDSRCKKCQWEVNEREALKDKQGGEI